MSDIAAYIRIDLPIAPVNAVVIIRSLGLNTHLIIGSYSGVVGFPGGDKSILDYMHGAGGCGGIHCSIGGAIGDEVTA